MQLNQSGEAAALGRALCRATPWVLGPIIAAYTLIAAVVVLSRSEDFLAWIVAVSTVGFGFLFPLALIVRIVFGRRLRRYDPILAERLGFGPLRFNGAATIARNEVLFAFLWHREYLALGVGAPRMLASVYRIALLIMVALGAVMLGGILVLFSIAYSLLPRP